MYIGTSSCISQLACHLGDGRRKNLPSSLVFNSFPHSFNSCKRFEFSVEEISIVRVGVDEFVSCTSSHDIRYQGRHNHVPPSLGSGQKLRCLKIQKPFIHTTPVMVGNSPSISTIAAPLASSLSALSFVAISSSKGLNSILNGLNGFFNESTFDNVTKAYLRYQ